MTRIIDSHQHFWKYTPNEYGWIDSSMAALQRDFSPADLEREIDSCGVDEVITVQTRETLQETRWLLHLARSNAFIAGVVGWAPLIDSGVSGIISPLTELGPLKGVRHILQGGADERYMLREDFNRGISVLREFNLVYDVLIFERQLPQTIEFVDRHPNQVFVLDHVAKPRIRDGVISPWQDHIRSLAERPNVFCKLSGMVTEADQGSWTEEQLEPYFDTVLEAFRPERLMFGSDWPVCLLATSYANWINLVRRRIAPLSDDERSAILGGTASRVYGI
jgi:L-fuconolactonase